MNIPEWFLEASLGGTGVMFLSVSAYVLRKLDTLTTKFSDEKLVQQKENEKIKDKIKDDIEAARDRQDKAHNDIILEFIGKLASHEDRITMLLKEFSSNAVTQSHCTHRQELLDIKFQTILQVSQTEHAGIDGTVKQLSTDVVELSKCVLALSLGADKC